MPSLSPGISKLPCSSDVTDLAWTLVSTSSRLIATPGTTAPDGSVTVPRIVDKPSCAGMGTQKTVVIKAIKQRAAKRILRPPRLDSIMPPASFRRALPGQVFASGLLPSSRKLHHGLSHGV